jgi:hypothetical protein
MWVIPNNLPAYLVSAQDSEVSSKDLKKLVSISGQSLTWNAKPSLLQTWLKRLKRNKWMQPLFGRMLEPSLWGHFETMYKLWLEAIHANHLVSLDREGERMTQDTCGPILQKPLRQLDLFDVFSKTSKDTLPPGCATSSRTWPQWITEQRGEYSARLRSAHHTNEKGFLSWPTPTAHLAKEGAYPAEFTRHTPTLTARVNWPTGQPCQDKNNMIGKSHGLLNPEWVEQLMGVPVGWTDLDC